jgi:hypothetical protein
MMNKMISIIMGLLVFCLLLSGVWARARADEREFLLRPASVLASGANRLLLGFNIQHAKVTFRVSEDSSFIVKVLVKYDGEAFAPAAAENFSDGTFSATFASGAPAAKEMTSTVHEWEIEIGRYDLETDLALYFTGVQGAMDLGGMPLSALMLDLKGSRTELDFSEPTPFSLRKFGISCDGTFFTSLNIGNTGFESFQLRAMGSSIELDFDGVYGAGDYNAGFDFTGSSAIINLPGTVGALVVHRPANPSVELAGGGWATEMDKAPEGYMTDDYENRQSKLNLYMASKASSVHIERGGTDLQYQISY